MLMGSRISHYRDFLRFLVGTGYSFRTFSEFVDAAETREFLAAPICLLRNDVDSDPAGAALMFACDRAAGVRATYFFRLSTLDTGLVREIVDSGGEVGYHYEEIATLAKRLGWRSRQQVDAHMDLVRREFRENILRFATRTGTTPRIVAAHGDFANRHLAVPNHYLLDQELMKELGILADAYDRRVHDNLRARFSDWPAPQWWNPTDPAVALRDRPATVSILVHPRQWTCNPLLNFRLDALRLCEELGWRWRGALAAPASPSA
jgi:hypothetical protein